MSTVRYLSLGPLLAGAGSRAFLGLALEDGQPPRPVVLIWAPQEVVQSPELTARLTRETNRALVFDHPHILRVHSLAAQDGGLARVTEFADGEPLRRVLEAHPRLPPPLAALIAADAATGLHYAHMAGNDDGTPLVHGDVRPETLMVSFSGVTKVTGYGALSVAPRERDGKRVKNRRAYSAPEQLLGGREAVNVQSDVFLLGLVLHECLSGKMPFKDNADPDKATLTRTLPTMQQDVPLKLDAVVRKATAKRAYDRYPSAHAFREAIVEAVGTLPAHTSLADFLAKLFPPDNEARAARRRVIDAGIADVLQKTGVPPPAVAEFLATGSLPAAIIPKVWPTLQGQLSILAAVSGGTSDVQLVSEPTSAATTSSTPAASTPGTATTPAASTPGTATASAASTPGTATASSAPAATSPGTAPSSVDAATPIGTGASSAAGASTTNASSVTTTGENAGTTGATGGSAHPAATSGQVAPAATAPSSTTGSNPVVGASTNTPASATAPNGAVAPQAPTPAGGPTPPAAGAKPRRTWIPIAGVGLALALGTAAVVLPKLPSNLADEPEDAGTLAVLPPVPFDAGTDAGAPERPQILTGLVDVTSDPRVDVSIPGTALGRTPLTATLPVGRHVLTLSNSMLGIQTSRTVTITANGRASLQVYLNKSYVTVRAPKDAIVTIDGRLVGAAPVEEQEIYEGNHQLLVIASGARWQKAFKIEAGQRMNFDVDFEAPPEE
ncbi:PEGA domain-containing protein [Myxococcus stipitatus]|uniref:serine/threonine-protein kinase n=1 Tax=Myxococcus stipitatus TaxID=83455 RepID=UPI001F3812C1|nr:serine/threonine-protein kinase [Myxococcus stipitatus]MCE9673487.1 PEGA domain-containing protein [Myxococcus stipitatus]